MLLKLLGRVLFSSSEIGRQEIFGPVFVFFFFFGPLSSSTQLASL